jgi:hypothetical protein
MAPMMRRSLLLPLAVAAAAMALAQPAGACIKRHEVPIAKGTSPTGWSWSVKGSIGPNGGRCRDWLFGMNFNLEGAVGWGSSTGIKPGSSYGGHPEVNASDYLLSDGSDRVFSGSVGGEVTRVLVTLSNNKHLVIHPKLPRPKLRRHVVWLRDVRYFVRYYRPEGFVTGVASFDRAGLLVSRDKTFETF